MNTPSTVIKIFGLGGGGSNAVNRMIDIGLEGVEYIAANTDSQALKLSQAATKIQIGPKLTKGLEAGGRWEVGREAALESRNEIRKSLEGADVVFLTCGMGGGTGTGAISVAAEIARGMGILTVAIVTTPFSFEASRRRANSEAGLEALRPNVDTLIQVSNDKLLGLVGRNVPFETALRVADEVLRQGVQGLTEMITRPGLINVDFNNVRAIMEGAGNAMMAIGQGKGENKAADAIHQALHMPLLDLPSCSTYRRCKMRAACSCTSPAATTSACSRSARPASRSAKPHPTPISSSALRWIRPSGHAGPRPGHFDRDGFHPARA